MKKQEVAKIAITSDADVALVQALEKVKSGNAGGRVTKLELATWLILKSAVDMNALAIDEIENLQSLLKQKNASSKKATKSEAEKTAARPMPEKLT